MKQTKERRKNSCSQSGGRKVLDALYWLKDHHTGYSDIKIMTENLDWMNGADSADLSEEKNKEDVQESGGNSQEVEENRTDGRC